MATVEEGSSTCVASVIEKDVTAKVQGLRPQQRVDLPVVKKQVWWHRCGPTRTQVVLQLTPEVQQID